MDKPSPCPRLLIHVPPSTSPATYRQVRLGQTASARRTCHERTCRHPPSASGAPSGLAIEPCNKIAVINRFSQAIGPFRPRALAALRATSARSRSNKLGFSFLCFFAGLFFVPFVVSFKPQDHWNQIPGQKYFLGKNENITFFNIFQHSIFEKNHHTNQSARSQILAQFIKPFSFLIFEGISDLSINNEFCFGWSRLFLEFIFVGSEKEIFE